MPVSTISPTFELYNYIPPNCIAAFENKVHRTAHSMHDKTSSDTFKSSLEAVNCLCIEAFQNINLL